MQAISAAMSLAGPGPAAARASGPAAAVPPSTVMGAADNATAGIQQSTSATLTLRIKSLLDTANLLLLFLAHKSRREDKESMPVLVSLQLQQTNLFVAHPNAAAGAYVVGAGMSGAGMGINFTA